MQSIDQKSPRVRQKCSALLPISFILAVLALASQPGYAAKAGKSTLVYCSEASPTSFNPQLANDSATFNATGNTIFNRLVEYSEDMQSIQGSLAESWEVSDGGKTVTFKLRPGVQFHTVPGFKPSRALNAEDVVFSFLRQLRKDHPYHMIGGGAYPMFGYGGFHKLLKDVVAVDPLTVRFLLNEPNAVFLAQLTQGFSSIHSKEYADYLLKEGRPQDIDMNPVGTGPFIKKSYAKDSHALFDAFPDYFRGRAKVDRLVISPVPDSNVRYQKLKAGECHIMNLPSPDHVASIRSESDLTLQSIPGFNIGYLAMNFEKPPLDNLRVRQAINYALNRKAYIEAVYNGNAIEMANPLPPEMWSYNEKIKPWKYDPAKAKQLIAAVKAEGVKFPVLEIWTLPVARPYNPNGKRMGEMMQADLKKIGIETKLVTYDWATYLAKIEKGEHQLVQIGWSAGIADPDHFLGTLLPCNTIQTGGNLSRWCNKEMSEKIAKARATISTKARTSLYKEVQEEFRQNAPWAPIAHSVEFKGLAKNVKGYKIHPIAGERFHEVSVE